MHNTHSNMTNIRLELDGKDEALVLAIAQSQNTSWRDAILNVFRRHGKEYTKKRIPDFSPTRMGRPKSSPSKTK
jgi:hypothetical protein